MPNTIPFSPFLTQVKGFYSLTGPHFRLLSPDSYYSKTLVKRLEASEVDLPFALPNP